MPSYVTIDEMLFYKCANPPLSEDTEDIGGAISSNLIYGNDPGDVHFTSFAAALGGGDKYQTSKFFCKNTHASATAQGVQFWGANFGQDLPTPGMPRFVSDSPLDNSGKKIRWIGYDNTISLAPQQGENNCNGLTSVSAADIYSFISLATLHDRTSNALVPASGTISIYLGDTLIGVIPPNYSTMICELDMGCAASVGDSVTIDNSEADPPVSVSRCRSQATCIAVPGGSLVSGAAIGIWSRWKLKERRKPSARIEALIKIRILAA